MRLGLFGGSFDPIHYGHLLLAEQCREQCELDEIWFLPAGRPPHKQFGKLTSGEQRAEMLELAVADHPAFHVSRIELERSGTTFTVETLQEIRNRHPEFELHFLLGSDSLRDLPTWREPARIGTLAVIVAVNRGRVAAASEHEWCGRHLPREIDERLRFVTIPAIDLSASDIRARVRRGASIRFMTPPAVETWIRENQLYRD